VSREYGEISPFVHLLPISPGRFLVVFVLLVGIIRAARQWLWSNEVGQGEMHIPMKGKRCIEGQVDR